MKTITIERILDITPIENAEQVKLQCQVMYHKEEQGIRASGNIYVKGVYFDGVQMRPLKEVIALDIFAPSDKLIADELFEIRILDSQFAIQDHHLALTIEIAIQGIESEEEPIEMIRMDEIIDDAMINEELQELKEIIDKEETVALMEETMELVEEVEEVVEPDRKTEEVKQEDKELQEDFFDGETMKQCYRIILIKQAMSYESLASKYQVDLMTLRMLNQDRPLMDDMLVFLPDR
ncbi:MAG: hypothetical protein PUF50_02810 [Erysipelotrichaceae bacterium]|nr:hypothetical protein [Erysipelotrichaceae bacterium]